MKILALIPARGGSKRLPGKNVKLLGEKPLIAWSIEATKGIVEICDVLVSTDSSEIADVSIQYGALVPWLRPDSLATDESSVIDAALHALDWYQLNYGEVDGLLLLQPTSPFRTVQTIRAGIQLFFMHENRPVLGVSKAKSHPMWCMKIEEDILYPFMEENGLESRSQDLLPAYTVNGSLYLISPHDLKASCSFFPENSLPLIIDSPREALDIDTPWDWALAECFLNLLIPKVRESVL